MNGKTVGVAIAFLIVVRVTHGCGNFIGVIEKISIISALPLKIP
jgi:hypothetical protein